MPGSVPGAVSKPATLSFMGSPQKLRDDRRFPSSHPEWEMPESGRHGRLCELLFLVLRAAVGDASTVGKDHFVYYDRKDPRRCLAPDAFVKLGVPNHLVDSWKTWDLGVPELCIEVLSPSDTEEKLTFREKLRRYNLLKNRELVVFRADGKPGKRLRAWDRRGGHLIERVVLHERTACRTLGLDFAVVPDEELGSTLRLFDREERLIPTPIEHERAARVSTEERLARVEAELAELRLAVARARR